MKRDEYSLKNIATLHPAIRGQVEEVYIEYMEGFLINSEEGVRVTCGMRSPEDQDVLYKNHKSNAKRFESFHNFGMAFDFCILLPGGRVDYRFYKYVIVANGFIKVFDDLGWKYSGDWNKTGFTEEGHLQCEILKIEELKKLDWKDGYPSFTV
jgi:peptidoglycan L-alanyl-D-glutamate endopeptidase CwlK